MQKHEEKRLKNELNSLYGGGVYLFPRLRRKELREMWFWT